MLSRFTFPAVAAMLFAGAAFNSAVASPTDATVNHTVASVAETNNSAVSGTSSDAIVTAPAVPKKSTCDSVAPKPAVVDPNQAAAESQNAAERARLNSAVFASPSADRVAITDGAKFELPKRPSTSLDDSLQSRSRDSSDYDFRYVDPYRSSIYGPLSVNHQDTVDRIADSIAPGFGRVEFDSGKSHIRIDYLYSRSCRVKGAGICFRMSF